MPIPYLPAKYREVRIWNGHGTGQKLCNKFHSPWESAKYCIKICGLPFTVFDETVDGTAWYDPSISSFFLLPFYLWSWAVGRGSWIFRPPRQALFRRIGDRMWARQSWPKGEKNTKIRAESHHSSAELIMHIFLRFQQLPLVLAMVRPSLKECVEATLWMVSIVLILIIGTGWPSG